MSVLLHAQLSTLRVYLCRRHTLIIPTNAIKRSIRLLSVAKSGGERKRQREEEKPVKKKRPSISELIAEYGTVFTVYWGLAYFTCWAGFYSLLDYAGPELGVTIAKACYIDRVVPVDPTASTLILSGILNEAFEVVRLPIILFTIPYVKESWVSVNKARGVNTTKKKANMTDMIKQHGLFFLGYWTSLWALNGIACYGLIETFGPEAAVSTLKYIGAHSLVDLDSINPQYFNIGFALAVNELLEPIRFPFARKSEFY